MNSRVEAEAIPAVPTAQSEEPYETAEQIAKRLHVQREAIYDWLVVR